MISLLSPAKSLDFETPPVTRVVTQPDLLDQSGELVTALRDLTASDLSSLMSISEKLGTLNHRRFAGWSPPFDLTNAKQAILAFTGDVYRGLDATSLREDDFAFAQDHLRILSGLYGILRPLDLIQAYRLEMGTRLQNDRGKDLYAFWGDRITNKLNEDLRDESTRVVLNLASNEYFKSVNVSALEAEVISPVFKDLKNGTYRIISFYAKKARGLMTRWIVQHRIDDPSRLPEFDIAGYYYSPEHSEPDAPVFFRDAKPDGSNVQTARAHAD